MAGRVQWRSTSATRRFGSNAIWIRAQRTHRSGSSESPRLHRTLTRSAGTPKPCNLEPQRTASLVALYCRIPRACARSCRRRSSRRAGRKQMLCCNCERVAWLRCATASRPTCCMLSTRRSQSARTPSNRSRRKDGRVGATSLSAPCTQHGRAKPCDGWQCTFYLAEHHCACTGSTGPYPSGLATKGAEKKIRALLERLTLSGAGAFGLVSKSSKAASASSSRHINTPQVLVTALNAWASDCF